MCVGDVFTKGAIEEVLMKNYLNNEMSGIYSRPHVLEVLTKDISKFLTNNLQ